MHASHASHMLCMSHAVHVACEASSLDSANTDPTDMVLLETQIIAKYSGLQVA